MHHPAVPLPAPPRRRGWRRIFFVAAGVAFLSGGICSVRADEITRRIQEELRKRNLYFGDVDGRPSPQLSAALHRYQERKGFSSTGETDANTLYSLNIARPDQTPPHAAATAAPGPTLPPPLDARDGGLPWPDITVLRSDEARPGPTPGGGETPALAGETAVRTPAAFSPAPPPAAAGVFRRPSVEQVRDYVIRYLQAGQNNDPAGEMAFYGESVAYYDEGNVDHAYIARDVDRYDRRWPDRRFALIEPVTVTDSPDGDPDKFVVNFRYGFSVRGPHQVVGKAENTWTVSTRGPDGWKIVSMKEQRVRGK